MSETKACSLTEEEVEKLLMWHGQRLEWSSINVEEEIDRINYLHKRLKAFAEASENQPKAAITEAQTGAIAAAAANAPVKDGW